MFITAKLAKQIAGGSLPKIGHERFVTHEGFNYWLSQTRDWGKLKWWLRATDARPFGS